MFDTYLFALMTSYVLLYMLAVRAAGHTCMLDRMLSWRGFRPIAKLSYSAYLLHPMVVLLLWSRVNWDLASAGAIMILEHAGLSIIVTHLAALILYLLVERPLHRLGRRLTR
jgi:peptidoglycan/LPS O-acetylase OafA/YrhL